MAVAPTKTISVVVPAKLNLVQSQAILASVLKRGGCPTCISGLRINFETEVERFTVDTTTHELV